jgi:hypothetical protein
MSNEIRNKLDALIQKAIEDNPRINDAKKFIYIVCAVFLASRFIFLIVKTTYVLNKGLHISSCLLNYFLLAVGVLFAFGICKQGIKALAYLVVAGGLLTLLNLFRSNFISNLRIGDTFYNVYVITLIVAMSIQIISMLLIIFNSDCKKYFDEITKINSVVIKQGNDNRLK